MRKLFNHSAYWALVYGGALALGIGVARVVGWLAARAGVGPMIEVGIGAALLLFLFFAKVVSSCRDPKSDAAVRAHFAALGRICGVLLCWRTVLMAVLAFFAWFAWRDIGSYHEAHSWAVPDALLVLGLLVGLAALAFLAGRESRVQLIGDLRESLDFAKREVESVGRRNSSLIARLRATTMTPGASAPTDAPVPAAELSSADLLAASRQFAAQA